MRIIAFLSLAIVAVSGLLAGVLSLYTGDEADLPKWNGVGYFVFCVGEGLFIGVPLGILFLLVGSLIVFVWRWSSAKLRQKDGILPSNPPPPPSPK